MECLGTCAVLFTTLDHLLIHRGTRVNANTHVNPEINHIQIIDILTYLGVILTHVHALVSHFMTRFHDLGRTRHL